MKKRKTKKINYILLICSLVLMLIAFLISKATIIRFLLCIVGIVLLELAIVKKQRKLYILYFLLFFFSLIVLDSLVVITFKRIPIFSYNIINSNDVRVYNAVGVRVWQCNDKELIVDSFYNKGYSCSPNSLETISVNSFLSSVTENYNEYKNRFIKINGKISKKDGKNYIEMQAYDSDIVNVNGYVNFYNNVTLKIVMNDEEDSLDYYDVYDSITVVGKISNLENENGNYEVYMGEAKLVSSFETDGYIISVSNESKCGDKLLIHSGLEKNVYMYCLTEAIVQYKDNSKYELAVALSSNKLKIEDLYENYLNVLSNDEDATVIYKMKKYNVMVCDPLKSKDVIIGSTKMNFKNTKCNLMEEE